MKRPLFSAVLVWLVVLTVLYMTGRNKPAAGYERMKDILDGQEVTLSGRIRRITGAAPDRTYYIDHIQIGTTDTYRNIEISSVTYAEEIFLSVPADMNIVVRTGTAGSADDYIQQKELKCDDQVMVSGTAVFPEAPSNPGQFDDELYCLNRDILFRIYEAEIKVTQKGHGILPLLQKVRDQLGKGYRSCLPENEASVMTGITLGDSSQIETATKDLFREGGIAHILAISALHVHLLAMSLYRFLRKKAFSFPVCSGISLLIMAAYMVMTGMSHSSVRAFVMFALWCLSQVTGRKTDLPTSLAFGALILTLRHPALIAESGFWLSFGCVLSLNLLSDPIRKRLFAGNRGKGLGRNAQKAIASSLAVSAGTLPISAFFSFQITPWSFLANLVILPCMSILFVFGCAGSLLGALQVNAGRFVLSACCWLVRIFLLICRAERKLPCGVLITGRPGWVKILLYYLILGAALFAGHRNTRRQKKKRRILRRMVFLLAFAGGMGILAFQIPTSFRSVFLDVGQGDCTLICLEGRSYLVDCGSSSVENVWNRRVSPALKYYGIARLDGIFVTHGDHDHISGISELLDTYERNILGDNCADVSIDMIFVTKAALAASGTYTDKAAMELAAKAEGIQIPVTSLTPGDRIFKESFLRNAKRKDEGVITCLYPSWDDIRAAGDDANMKSMVLEIRYEDVILLMMGDLEKGGEDRFTQEAGMYGHDDPATTHVILKTGHHGSGNATSRELLDLFCPETAVISCGRNNRYGHPAQTVLQRLWQAGVRYYRTDLDGAVAACRKRREVKFSGWGSG